MNLLAVGRCGRVGLMGVLLVAAGSVSLILPASAVAQTQQIAQASPLTGSWRLANMTAGNLPTPMLPSEELTAEFAAGQIAGSGGCNRFMGSYQAEAETLTIGPLASTFKACEESIMTQETRYLQALQGAQRYEVSDQGLTISYQTEEGAGVLRFVQADAEAEGSGTPGGTQENTQEDTQEGVRGLW